MKKIIIGSRNPAKINEWREFLNSALKVDSLEKGRNLGEPQETGSTFAENARLKAAYFAQKLGEYVLSDDGGFEIDALGGAPGVKSRRILPGDRDGTDQELIDYVLAVMKDLPAKQRTARLTSALAVSDPQGKIVYQDQASFGGMVSRKAVKVIIPGYPFRSLLYVPEFGKTYAEFTEDEHQKVNHRKKMAEKLIVFLASLK